MVHTAARMRERLQLRLSGIGVWLCLVLGAIGLLAAPADAGAAARPASIGGEVLTSPQQAPWSVYLEMPGVHSCSGSIIDATHIITAAHCVFNEANEPIPLSDYRVTAGFVGPAPAPQGEVQERRVVGVRSEPNYTGVNHGLIYDDVAILTMNSPLDLSTPGVKAIPIVGLNAGPLPGALTRTVGFGITENGQPSIDLRPRSLVQTTLRERTCGAGQPSLHCSRSETGALCHGDSGSGVTSATNPPVLVAVHSFALDGVGGECVAGNLNGGANLAAPELQQWLAGNESPPRAPTTTGYPTILATANGEVGSELVCEPPVWTGAPTLGTEFVVAGTEQTLYSGPSNRYLIQPTNLGMTIGCVSLATNAGGTTESNGTQQGFVVQLAPPKPKTRSKPKGPSRSKESSRRFVHLGKVKRGANGWKVQLRVSGALQGKRAKLLWKVTPCGACGRAVSVKLEGETDVRSPRVSPRAEGILVVKVPGVTRGSVSYGQSTIRVPLGPSGRRSHGHHH
jgi:hypothetical protein